jgi:hypothetical protein
MINQAVQNNNGCVRDKPLPGHKLSELQLAHQPKLKSVLTLYVTTITYMRICPNTCVSEGAQPPSDRQFQVLNDFAMHLDM